MNASETGKTPAPVNPDEARVVARQAVLTSVLSGMLFVLTGPGLGFRAAGVPLALLTLAAARRLRAAPAPGMIAAVVLLQGLQLALFLSAFAATTPPFSWRLLWAAGLLALLGSAATAFIALRRPDYPRWTVRAIWSLAALVGLGELVFRVPAAPVLPPEPAEQPGWSGAGVPHPRLGTTNPADTTLLSYVAESPEGYYAPVDLRGWRTRLNLSGESRATARYPGDRTDVTRIEVARAPADTLWHIQYVYEGLRLDSGRTYLVEFRARADRPRPLNLNVTQTHPPWGWLGLYRDYALRPEWQSFRERFVAPGGGDRAGLSFNFGGNAVSAELAGVRLRSLPDSQPVTPPPPPRPFQIAYRFNGQGCRGRNYAVPKPPGVRRVLLLGDEQTLGLGLHEEDTYAGLVERDAGAAGRGHEVINCGVPGYATWDERLFYEVIGRDLGADLVVLVATPGDDLAHAELVRRGWVDRHPARLESLLGTWGAVQRFRHRRRDFEYRASVRQVLELDRLVRERGAALAVGVFYGGGPADSGRLAGALREGLQAAALPLLELGPPAEADSQAALTRLRVAHREAAGRLADFLRGYRWPAR